MLNIDNLTGLYLVVMNIFTFSLFALDKYRAIHHLWRIKEFTLMMMAVLGGGLGAFLAMQICHHKTRHFRFRVFVPLFMIIQIIGFIVCFKI
ncbi:DUF1294 domain-containing protein [[Clostridium] spiroforme]|nr:DUF1294 domain-containing protein [Thomasclavelia spiroformis]MBM6879887.1 DUF1294 domain-containing protein [Thomasclavelia spiroformis]MBM6931274.1 DUF1294 domain-containing protein [Thomasclavelia spiroformis]